MSGYYERRSAELQELVGMEFDRLTVLEVVGFSAICRCFCGKTKTTKCHRLTSRHVKSCGCLQAEGNNGRGRTTHGMARSPTYRIWAGIIQRCTNKKTIGWKNYGGRGISVCKRWLVFENFLSDMGARPTENHSIDRNDNDRGYCKSNCRWATETEQKRNTRRCIFIKCNGETKTIAEWAEVLGIPSQTIVKRRRMGWTDQDAVMTAVDKGRRNSKAKCQ